MTPLELIGWTLAIATATLILTAAAVVAIVAIQAARQHRGEG